MKMALRLSALLVAFCVTGVVGYPRVPRQLDFLSEIDSLSDESSDIIFQPSQPPMFQVGDESEEEGLEQPIFDDPKVYGMNIGLHFLLESIKRKMAMVERVHMESLIKVLVMTHNIEKVGGTVNEGNRMALKDVIKLFPSALKEATKTV